MLELNNKKVDFKVFIWAIGIILMLFVVVFNVIGSINGKISETNGDVVEMKVMLGEIRTDLKWIKASISSVADN